VGEEHDSEDRVKKSNLGGEKKKGAKGMEKRTGSRKEKTVSPGGGAGDMA